MILKNLFGINSVKDLREQVENIFNQMDLASIAKNNIKSINLNPWDVWNDGELKDQTITKYTTQINGLTAAQAKAVLSTTSLNEAQRQQVLANAGLLASDESLIVSKRLITVEQQKQLISSGLVTKADLDQAMSLGILTLSEEGNLVATKSLTAAEIEKQLVDSGMSAITAKNIAMLYAETGAKTANTGATGLLTKAVLALNAAWLANPVGVIVAGFAAILATIGAVCIGVSAYNKTTNGMIKNNQKLIDSNKEVYDALLEEEKVFTDNADSLKKAYDNYLTATKGSSEYYDAINKIAELSPELVVGYDNEGNAILANNKTIKAQIEYYKQLAEEKRNAARNEALGNLKEETDSYQDLKNQKDSKQQQLDEAQKKLDYYNSIIEKHDRGETLSDSELEWYNNASNMIHYQRGLVESLKGELKDISDQMLISSNSLRTYYTSLFDTVDGELTDTQKALREGLLDTAIEQGMSYDDFKSAEDLLMNNNIVKKAAEEILNLDENLTDEEYRKQALAIYDKLASEFELTDGEKQAFKVAFGIDDESIKNAEETKANNLESIKNKIEDGNVSIFERNDIQDWANTLSEDDLNIVANLVFDENTTKESLEKALNTAKGIVEEFSKETTKSEMIDLINSMSDGFDVLDDIYADIFDKGSFDFTKLDSKKFSDSFEGLKDEYEEFIETVSSSPTDIKACQEAFNNLATAFINNKGILENLTEENSNVAISMLKNMGIANAEEIVMAHLTAQTEALGMEKQFCAIYGHDLANATYEEAAGFISQAECSAIVKQELAQLALAKINVNENKINTASDIDNVIALANAARAGSAELAQLARAKSVLSAVEGAGGDIRKAGVTSWEYNEALKIIDEINNGTFQYNYQEIDSSQFKASLGANYTGGDKTKDAMDKAADAAEKAAEEFDFFERRVKVLEDAFNGLEQSIENVVGAFAKNKLVDAQLDILDKEFSDYTEAIDMYQSKANEYLAKIPEGMRDKVVNGDISISTISDENLKEAINDYQTWADKVTECTQKLEELKTQLRELELQKFNNIVEDYTNQFDLFGSGKDLIDGQISLLEESGEIVGRGYYDEQIKLSNKQLSTLEAQKAAMVKQMADALDSGRIQTGTEEWLEMVNAITEVDASILECKTDIEGFENAILELEWANFERLNTEFDNINDELGNLVTLLNDYTDIEVSDGEGNWTDKAITALGLYTQQYELAKHRVAEYSEQLEKLEDDYAAGKYSTTEYLEKLAELKQGQYDAVNAAEDMEDAIISLNETRVNEEIETINEQIEAYKEVVDAQLEAIETTEKLADRQEDLADKSKSVADIERKLAAMQNDTTAAAIAERKQLEEELYNAKKELADAEHDYSIEDQKDALNKQYENFEKEKQDEITALEESLKEREALLQQSFETVKANTDVVAQELLILAQEHGINVSTAITTAWANGENAIASYGVALTSGTSAFIGNLDQIQFKVYDLQTQADNTSVSIANMFGQRADTLVQQLTSAYSSEENLQNMTNALQNNLINTLERGYDISSITSGLNAIRDAANDTANALRDMYNAANGGGGGGGDTPTYTPDTYPRYGAGNPYQSVEDHADKTDKADPTSYQLKGRYYIEDRISGEKVRVNLSKEEADQLLKDQYYNGRYTIKAYAKGGIVSKSDDGVLNSIAKSVGEDTMVAVKYGEGILTPIQTEALANLAPLLGGLQGMWNGFEIQSKIPEIHRNERPNVTLHYDKMFEFNGDFNNSEELLSKMTSVASKVTTKVLNDINRDYRVRH